MALAKFITGGDQISKTLDALGAEMRTNLTGKAVGKVGKEMQQAMIFLAPVRFGALRQALAMKTIVYKKDGAAVSLSGTSRRLKFTTPASTKKRPFVRPAKYMHLVEFGHVDKSGKFHAPKHPFVRPAVDAVAPRAGDIMGRELSEGIERLVKRYKKTIKN